MQHDPEAQVVEQRSSKPPEEGSIPSGVATYNVLCRFWDPICGKFGKTEELANISPLSRDEADAMFADLQPCLSDYRGQGQGLLALRIAAI